MHNTTLVSLTDYKAHVTYDVFGGGAGAPPAQCHERPERNPMPNPPVEHFTYNGTVTFRDGVKAYRYTEPQFLDQEYFTTADAKQTPLAFFDRRDETAIEFRNFKAVAAGAWPAGTFAKPSTCK